MRTFTAVVFSLASICAFAQGYSSSDVVTIDTTRIKQIAERAIIAEYKEAEPPTLVFRGISIESDTNDVVTVNVSYIDLGSHTITTVESNRMIISDSVVDLIPVTMDRFGGNVKVGLGKQTTKVKRFGE